MELDDALQSLHDRFTYKRDRGEVWRLLPAKGPVTGDCEDFALTLIREVEGKFWWPLIKGDYRIYYCEFNGAGHAVVAHRETLLFADNIGRTWRTYGRLQETGYDSFDKVGVLKVAWRLMAGLIKRD